MNWSDKTIVLTGGTGSFGKKFTEIMLKKYKAKTISNRGMSRARNSGGRRCTQSAPAAAPQKVQMTAGHAVPKATSPLCQKFRLEVSVPNVPCSLLVARTSTGPSPVQMIAGTVIRPPPPAMASTRPAKAPTANKSRATSGERLSNAMVTQLPRCPANPRQRLRLSAWTDPPSAIGTARPA